jgi:hypothetical protein
MSESNGVVRIAKKGMKKFAFGEEGQLGSEPFEIDVVNVFQEWMDIDDALRVDNGERRVIPDGEMPNYHKKVVAFVKNVVATHSKAAVLGKEVYVPPITTAEALDFLARLREAYDDLVVFFRFKSREERGSPGTSAGESSSTSPQTKVRFSAEDS